MEKPLYHFAPAKNWMNDPNGTVFDGEKYHLFYQYNPNGSSWGDICWAYAVSRDLLNWQRRGIRLSPERARGEAHCFSGCAFPAEGGYTVAYTSVGEGENAASERAEQVFCSADPVFCGIERRARINAGINPFPVREWRDPFLFSYNGKNYMLLAGMRGSRGCIFLYAQGGGAYDWRFVGELYGREGEMLECPNAVLFGNRMALFYSSSRDVCIRAACGDFDGERFAVREEYPADFGDCIYASNLSAAAGGGTAFYAWMRETEEDPARGYSGCLALPRLFSLSGYRPLFAPLPALCSLEGELLPAGARVSRARVRLPLRGNVCLLRGEEGDGVRIEAGGGRIRVFRTRKGEPLAPLSMPAEGDFADLYLDGTAAEMYAGGRVMSFRFYGEGCALLPEGGAAAREMRPAEISGE